MDSSRTLLRQGWQGQLGAWAGHAKDTGAWSTTPRSLDRALGGRSHPQGGEAERGGGEDSVCPSGAPWCPSQRRLPAQSVWFRRGMRQGQKPEVISKQVV